MNEEDTKQQAVQAFCEKLGSFITMIPEEHRCEAAAMMCFTAIMSGADGDPWMAKGIAAEVTDQIRATVEEHFVYQTPDEECDENKQEDEYRNEQGDEDV